MKQILSCATLLLLAAAAFAQVDNSLQNTLTNGLIRNSIDAALSIDETLPGPDFSGLAHNYLFGGFENLNLATNTQATTAGLPLLGIHLLGDVPLTLYTKIDLLANSSSASTSAATATPASVAVTSGTTTTNYNCFRSDLVSISFLNHVNASYTTVSNCTYGLCVFLTSN